MLKFRLNPPSGHADSYLDVNFVVEFEKADKAEIRLFNEEVNQPLEILAVSYGFITDETIAVIKNSSSVEGFINVFNRDKMNSSFAQHMSIDIRCEATLYRGENKEVIESVVTFYNESKSLDCEVIPFDIQVNNPEINLSQNEPLRLTLICDSAKHFELTLRSERGNKSCAFEVDTRPGQTNVAVPCEILAFGLGLDKAKNRHRFHLYWTKFEGLDYSKMMNRKPVKISNSAITLVGRDVMPKPQGRLGPIGELSEDFVLSDKYFVHTHKDFSGFGSKHFDSIKMKRLTFFMHEAQDMGGMDEQHHGKRMEQTGSTLAEEKLRSKPARINALGISKKKRFLETFSPIFNTTASSEADQEPVAARKVSTGGCAGCGRKKNNK